jgi:hypothetical protein
VTSGTPQSTTGINHWWTYQEEKIPGVGRVLVNIGTGNLLVQADDVDLKERGIDLAFRRTYNSQSLHNAQNGDGSGAAIFGNGWTNPFDAHIAYNAQTNVLSVYDIDGARYDWSSNGQGQWIPPAGMQGTTLTATACGYEWTKKNGTIYSGPPLCRPRQLRRKATVARPKKPSAHPTSWAADC